MEPAVKELKSFLDGAHSLYHAVDSLVWELEAAGYACLPENGSWELVPGGRYYTTRGASAVIAFRLPQGTPTGFMLSASHSDRPSFKLKENGELTGKYTRLSVEKYGGMLMAPWLDRPLSVAGRVMVETEHGLESRLVDIDRDLLLIPNVAIHMNREANSGYKWNPAVDMLPLVGGEQAKGKLLEELESLAGGHILGHDLYLYIRQKASIWGVEEEYISAAGLDDLACAWCCTRGFLESGDSPAIPVLCVLDSEEVGSCSPQGAASGFLDTVLDRICRTGRWDKAELLSQSFMVSADNAHALHPNQPALSDGQNAPLLNGGVVLKFSGSLRYATDGLSGAVWRKVCGHAQVPVQTFYNRADLPGGSTLGTVSLAQVAVPTVDIGLPQLAMHSCYETCGVRDVGYLAAAMTAYYGAALDYGADGGVHLSFM